MPGREHRLHTNDLAVCVKVEAGLGDVGRPGGGHQRKVVSRFQPYLRIWVDG